MLVTFFGPFFLEQDKVYSNNPHILDEVKHSRSNYIKVSEPKLMSNYLLKKLELHLRVEANYFEHPL
jgi:hypothetical protein